MWKSVSAIVLGVSAFALVAGGAAAGDYPVTAVQTGPGLSSARAELSILDAALSPRSLTLAGPDFAAAVGLSLVRSARLSGLSAREALSSALPRGDAVLAMLALDRDIDDFLESSSIAGAAGAHYRRAAALALQYRPLRANYEAAYAAIAREIGAEQARSGGPRGTETARNGQVRPEPLFPRKAFRRPTISDMSFAHPYALDLFFQDFAQRRDGQAGPPIPAISGGIVVAAAGDWKGGAGPQAWAGGGLSPAAGNGLVIYDPDTRRYFSYFHFRSIALACGDLVARGQILGTGGNTGMNARRPDHGGHVHLEIFDAARNRALSALEILDLLDI